MRLLAAGCSFTVADRDPSWASYTAQKLFGTLTNVAYPGAGNTYIANTVLLNNQPVDLVMIMWSGLTRKDIIIDHSDNLLHKTFELYPCYVGWPSNPTGYLLSGGHKNGWLDHAATLEVFKPLYKFATPRSMALETLLAILNTQTYLKQNNIPYLMSSYINYWNTENLVGDMDYGLLQFPEFQYLVDRIDFDPWVFLNEQKDGIFELADKTPQGFINDGFHPDLHVHEMWSELVVNKIKERSNDNSI